MSGGHFDHQQSYLGNIAEQLAHDIEYNDISYEHRVIKEGDHHYGFELEPKTVEFMRDVMNRLRQLEKTFQERVGIK